MAFYHFLTVTLFFIKSVTVLKMGKPGLNFKRSLLAFPL